MSSNSGDDELITPSIDAIETRPPAENTAKKQRGRPYKAGRSGNPEGRPRGSRNKATMAVEALLDGEAKARASSSARCASRLKSCSRKPRSSTSSRCSASRSSRMCECSSFR